MANELQAKKEMSMMNAKGRVKLELYDETGVVETIEKKNLVVQDSNKIVAMMMANPGKKTRYPYVEKGAASVAAGVDGFYDYQLKKHRFVDVVHTFDPGAANTDKTFTINQKVEQIKEVSVGGSTIAEFEGYTILDASVGKIEFVDAPKASISVSYLKDNKVDQAIVKGSEKVFIAGVQWKRGATPIDSAKVYAFDEKRGIVKFQSTKVDVKVEVEIEMPYGLGFMALGGKPAGAPDFQAIAFSRLDKLKKNMPEELANTRVPINFPAEITSGIPEVEVFNTKAALVEAKTQNVTITEKDGAIVLGASLDLVSAYGSRDVYRLVSAIRASDSKDFVLSKEVQLNDAKTGAIAFTTGKVAKDDVIAVKYELLLSSDHRRYSLAEAPAIEIKAVRHTHAVTGEITQYKIEDSGLTIGKGDVWFSNPNAGQIEFAAVPVGTTGVKNAVEVPGQLTIEYFVNAGTTVKFVADFPKEIPDVSLVSETKTQALSGATTVSLLHPIAKNEQGKFLVTGAKVNGADVTEGTGYSVAADGLSVTFLTATGTESIKVVYQYEKTSFDVYQVAMFDGVATDSKMFNICPIGPVSKDRKTGMRVTWSVTF